MCVCACACVCTVETEGEDRGELGRVGRSTSICCGSFRQDLVDCHNAPTATETLVGTPKDLQKCSQMDCMAPS